MTFVSIFRFCVLRPLLARLLPCLLAGAAGALTAHAAPAIEAWPQRPVKLVVPFAPGGGSDIIARAMAQGLSRRLGQPVIVENRPGAATVIGTQYVARAEPDGYTLLLSSATSFSVNPALHSHLPYDPLRDLAPIAIVGRVPLVLVAGQATPWHSVAELVADAARRPGRIRYATYGPGSSPHLAGRMFSLAAGITLQDIPYRTTAQNALAVGKGEVEMSIDILSSVAANLQAGRVRALAVLGAHRSSLLPGVRTLQEQGLTGASFEAWFGVAAPARTPPPVMERFARAFAATLADAGLRAQLRVQGIEPVWVGANEFRAQAEGEIARYRALAFRTGITLD